MAGIPHLPLFHGVDPAQVEALFAAGEEVTIRAGEVVCARGRPLDQALLVLSGRLRLVLGPERGDPVDLWPGTIVGEEALYGSGAECLFTVVAAADTRALRLSRPAVEGLGANRAVLALELHLVDVLARRLKSVDADLRRAWTAQGLPRQAAKPGPSLLERLQALVGAGA